MIPFQHQIEDTIRIVNNPYFALLNEMGTGKSKTIIDAVWELYQEEGYQYAIIICPKTVISSWVNTHISLNFDSDYDIAVNFKWIKSTHINVFRFIVINYEKLRNEENFKLIQRVLKNKCVLILDESQKVANPRAMITKKVLKLAMQASRRYILSGTPIRKNPLDYYTQFKFLHPDILGFKSWYAFRGRYAIMGGYKVNGMPVQVVGFKNLDDLRSKVSPYFVRRTKKECLDLPEQLYQVQEVELDSKAKVVYKDMEEHALSMIGDDTIAATVKVVQLLKLRQITAGFLKDKAKNQLIIEGKSIHSFTNNKLKVLQEIDVGKLVIFCVFHHEIKAVKNIFLNILGQDDCLEISGRVTGNQRENAIAHFQGNTYDRIVVQVETGGLGIDLYAAHTAIYLSNHYNWDVRTQSESRIHRIGQNHPCTYIDVLATIDGKPTIDHDILHVIQKKKNFADYMLKEKEWK